MANTECPKPLSSACVDGYCTHGPRKPFPDGYLPGTRTPRCTPANIAYVVRSNA